MTGLQQVTSNALAIAASNQNSPANEVSSILAYSLGEGSGSGHVHRRPHLGIRTVAKLANKVVANGARSVMVHVFSRADPNPCSKTMNSMVLAAVGEPSGVSDASSLSEP